MTISDYLQKIQTRYKTGISTEHSYRGDLQRLLESLAPDAIVTNEPTRVSCGAPDYIITRRGIPVGYIEAKDLGADLSSKGYKEQFDRYRASLPNLILTNYLDFWLYRNGELVTKVSLGTPNGSSINPSYDQHPLYTALIQDFSTWVGQTITSSRKLAEMMAGKARLLAMVIDNALNSDQESEANSSLREQMEAFKTILIHDISHKEFADIYAQTIAYGMFAARLHDSSLQDFTRQEAANLIPKTNPFLRKLFQYIAGYDLDERISWIVDALADIFRATDVAALLKNFGSTTQQNDPIIHFYETFLAEYDPTLRKARGVWYTPEPVVSFIVRAVDDILKTEFGLKQGLADNSKTKITVQTVGKKTADARSKIITVDTQVEVHKVQILDPACGTGTFLAEIIKHLYKKYEKQKGIWSSYVENDLIPRLNGFELLMASYAMAHLKLDLLLSETGFKPTKDQRFKVFLTNSLEEYHPDTGTLFASWLSDEANQANRIKRDTPVMVVIGNPPYSGESLNKGGWILNLLDDYKIEPGGVQKLNEKNPKWINDDYVKFIRFGQHFIEKNGEGVLAFINPHGYLDNPTFRGMRWNLLRTFDKVYTLDLHGNSKKKETAPDGSSDENVFDIQQGVSINLFVKTGCKEQGDLAKVHHFDLYGKREHKYKFLSEHSIANIPFSILENVEPNFFFVPKNFGLQKVYNDGFLISELFVVNSVGMVTARDSFSVRFDKQEVKTTINEFLKLDDETARTKFDLGKDARDWTIEYAKKDLIRSGPDFKNIVKINYRPFDTRWTYYTGRSKGFLCMPRGEVMQHFLKGENVALNWIRPMSSNYEFSVFITDAISDQCSAGNKSAGAGISYVGPLFLYESDTLLRSGKKVPNLKPIIVSEIEKRVKLKFASSDLDGNPKTGSEFTPLNLLDFIYATLYSPRYRERYKEFLKIDFPRVPYPRDKRTFWSLVSLGRELREIHLLQSPRVDNYITSYPIDGDNVVAKPRFETKGAGIGRAWINNTQYFDDVPDFAWNFYIGGYQPAQKWLKDRSGRTLSHEEIFHYQKIIVALSETDRIMKEIDEIPFE